MAILWCGGEPSDFEEGDFYLQTNTDYHRSDYSRVAFCLGTPGFRKAANTFTEKTSLWASAYFLSGYYGGWCYGLAGDGGSDPSDGYYVYLEGRYRNFRLYKKVGEEKTLLVSVTDGSQDALYKIDLQIINYGVSGTINVYLNGTLRITYSGNLSLPGITGFNKFVAANGNGYSDECFMSECIVADEDTRTLSLVTLAPNASGDINEWAGAYTDIDDTANGDTDLISADTAGLDAQFELSDMPTGNFHVRAVKMLARAMDATETFDLAVGVKTNSAVHLSAPQPLLTAWNAVETLMLQNPETLSDWTVSEVDALQIAVQSVTAS